MELRGHIQFSQQRPLQNSIFWSTSNYGSYIEFSWDGCLGSFDLDQCLIFFVFPDVDILRVYPSYRLSLNLALFDVRFHFCIWGKNLQKCIVSQDKVHHIRRHIMLFCPFMGDVCFDHLVNIVPVRFYHCKVSVFLFGVNP